MHDIMLSSIFKHIQLNAHDMEIKRVKVVVIVIRFPQVRERTRGQFFVKIYTCNIVKVNWKISTKIGGPNVSDVLIMSKRQY
jgi:hypothetical protein